MRALFLAAAACALAAGALGTGLCFFRADGAWQVDLPLLAAGFVGFLGSTNYSTGIKFKYRGLGVPLVAFLMGPLELFVVCTILAPGSESAVPAMSSPALPWRELTLSLPVASLVCVIMHGNDMRDIPSDRAAGIKTVASMLGPKGALAFYWLCHLLPYAVCATLAFLGGRMFLLPFMAMPLTRRTLAAATRTYLSAPDSPPWRRLERASGGIHLIFGILYALSFVAAR